nr:GDP-mannose 4,6-dehydratase [uncultured Desulfobacter sp.]
MNANEGYQIQTIVLYAASKAFSGRLVCAYHETFGLNATISNCFNNYGPFQFPEKLFPLIIVNILDNKLLQIYGDGCHIRDWLYVNDHNWGVDLIIQKGISGETSNIGGNNEWKNIDIVRHICNAIDSKFKGTRALQTISRFTICKRPGCPKTHYPCQGQGWP